MAPNHKNPFLDVLRKAVSSETRLLVAVSGGADSVALLHGLSLIAAEKSLYLEVAHVDHQLRESSGRDAEFTASLATERSLVFHLRTLDPPGKENLEAWGRRERYLFFRELASERNLDFILTAHTENDLAETLLMRLLSNKEPRSILEHDPVRRCLRPMLAVNRTQIESFCAEQLLVWMSDETNEDTAYLRNRVRHLLIPLLEKEFHPDMVGLLATRARCLASDYQGLDELVSELITSVQGNVEGSPKWLEEIRKILQELPLALRWRVTDTLALGWCGFRPGRRKSEELLRVLLGQQLAVQLPGGKTVRRQKGSLVIRKSKGEGGAAEANIV